MPDFVEYITKEGDRWDSIAQKAYGDPTNITPIISANPGIALDAVIPSGLKMFIPVIDISQTSIITPPWDR